MREGTNEGEREGTNEGERDVRRDRGPGLLTSARGLLSESSDCIHEEGISLT